MTEIEIGKDYSVMTPEKLWDMSTIKTGEITISKATKAYHKGLLLSAVAAENGTVTFTPVTTALAGTIYIVAEDVAQNATKARVLLTGDVYLNGINEVNKTSFDLTKAMAATWAGTVVVLDRKEGIYAN